MKIPTYSNPVIRMGYALHETRLDNCNCVVCTIAGESFNGSIIWISVIHRLMNEAFDKCWNWNSSHFQKNNQQCTMYLSNLFECNIYRIFIISSTLQCGRLRPWTNLQSITNGLINGIEHNHAVSIDTIKLLTYQYAPLPHDSMKIRRNHLPSNTRLISIYTYRYRRRRFKWSVHTMHNSCVAMSGARFCNFAFVDRKIWRVTGVQMESVNKKI